MIKGGACLSLAVLEISSIDRRKNNPNIQSLKRAEKELNSNHQNKQ